MVEWPILEGEPDQIGVSVHFMDRGVDTGDILSVQKISPRQGETVTQLRNRFEPIMCQALVDGCIGFLEGTLERNSQRAEDGRQYFVMHPSLVTIVKKKLAQTSSQDTD